MANDGEVANDGDHRDLEEGEGVANRRHGDQEEAEVANRGHGDQEEAEVANRGRGDQGGAEVASRRHDDQGGEGVDTFYPGEFLGCSGPSGCKAINRALLHDLDHRLSERGVTDRRPRRRPRRQGLPPRRPYPLRLLRLRLHKG